MLNIPMCSKAEAKASLRIFQISPLHAFNGLSTHRQALWRGDFQPIVINHNLNARIVVAAMHYRVDNQLANGIRQNPIYVLPVHTLEPGTHMNVAQHILVELFDKLLPRRVITNVIGTPLSRANERNQHQYHGAHRQLQRLR